MIIHINPTLQSYLVLEKKTIYFLEHAATTSSSIIIGRRHVVALNSFRCAGRRQRLSLSRGERFANASRCRGWWLPLA